MAKYTNTLNLKKPDSEDFFDVSDQNGNMDIIDSAIEGLSQLAKSVGTSNAIELSVSHLKSYSNCLKISFVASDNNNGTATTVNVNQWGTKNLYKPNTTTAPVLIAGKAYDIWFDEASDCFFLKASAEGDATAAHVLAGKTFSNDDESGKVGEMPNRGLATFTPTYEVQSGEPGYYKSILINPIKMFTPFLTAKSQEVLKGKTFSIDGKNIITGTLDLSNLSPENIREGVTIGGVTGTERVLGEVKAGSLIKLTSGESGDVYNIITRTAPPVKFGGEVNISASIGERQTYEDQSCSIEIKVNNRVVRSTSSSYGWASASATVKLNKGDIISATYRHSHMFKAYGPSISYDISSVKMW